MIRHRCVIRNYMDVMNTLVLFENKASLISNAPFHHLIEMKDFVVDMDLLDQLVGFWAGGNCFVIGGKLVEFIVGC